MRNRAWAKIPLHLLILALCTFGVSASKVIYGIEHEPTFEAVTTWHNEQEPGLLDELG